MKPVIPLLLASLVTLFAAPAKAQEVTAETEACVLAYYLEGSADLTLAEIRERCGAAQGPATAAPVIVDSPVGEDEPVVARRLAQERLLEGRKWTILPHRPTFILPYTYNTSFDSGFYADLGFPNSDSLESYEAVFQVSLKAPLWYGVFGDRGDAYFAYTSRSWWQIYDSASAPFRETNYEPEFFLRFENDWEILGFRNSVNSVGIVHQSNGRSEPLSRSWNRVFASFLFEKDDFSFRVKPWYRLPESEEDDDNPNIERWLGYADYSVAWAPGDHRFFANVRNNLKSWDENKGSVEFTYSYPAWGGLRWYVQWFNGYGDGLIYYNEHSNRIGVGISLNDVL